MDSTYIVSYVAVAIAFIAVSIAAILAVPGGFIEGVPQFKEWAPFIIYYTSSYTCLVASTISLLVLLAVKQTEPNQVSPCLLRYGAIWPIYFGVVAVMVCAASMYSLMYEKRNSWTTALATFIVTTAVIIVFCNADLACICLKKACICLEKACIWLKKAGIWLKNLVYAGCFRLKNIFSAAYHRLKNIFSHSPAYHRLNQDEPEGNQDENEVQHVLDALQDEAQA